MKFRGFTLAEVLITLMIIGIVAALTIPSVISNAQQQEFKTGLKKAVSVLNAAIQANIAIEGETPYENRDLSSYLQRHMSVIKNMGEIYSCRDKNDKRLAYASEDGPCIAVGGDANTNRVFYTTDGMRYEVASGSGLYLHETGWDVYESIKVCKSDDDCSFISSTFSMCGSYGLAKNPNKTITSPCIVMVDVNGDKKPNSLITVANQFCSTCPNSKGVYSFPMVNDKKINDIFTIMITEREAIPFGVVAQRAMYSK